MPRQHSRGPMNRGDTSLSSTSTDRALAHLLGVTSMNSSGSHACNHYRGSRAGSHVGQVAAEGDAPPDESERAPAKDTQVNDLLQRTRLRNGRLSCDSTKDQEDTIAEKAYRMQRKFAKILGHADVEDGAWIHSIQANALFSSLILLNLVAIGFETDHVPGGAPNTDHDWWLWFCIQSFFAAAFLVEVVLRLRAERAEYWTSCWNYFDAFNCVLTVIETWVLMPIGHGALRQYMGVLRLLRLMRLVRVLRLLRFFHELWVVMQAMVSAVCSCSWVLILTLLIIYIFAIFTTMLLGQGAPDDDVTQQRWGKVANSMFTLFVVMSGEAWYDICLDAMQIQAWAWLLFVFYFSLMNLMVMNMFGSILVEKVLQCAKNRDNEQERANDSRALETFARLFVELDVDGDGVISREELLEGLENDHFRGEFYDANVCLLKDLDFLVGFWDCDDSGSIEFDEFVNGVQQLRHSGNNQKLLLLHHDIHSYGEQVLAAIAQRGGSPAGAGACPDQKAWEEFSEKVVRDIGRTIDRKLKEHRASLRQDIIAFHKVAQLQHVPNGVSHGSVFFDNKKWVDTSELAANSRSNRHGKAEIPGDDEPGPRCGGAGGPDAPDPWARGPADGQDLHGFHSAARKKSRKSLAKRGERSMSRTESKSNVEHSVSSAYDHEPSPRIVSCGSQAGNGNGAVRHTPGDVDNVVTRACEACGAEDGSAPVGLVSPVAPCAAAGNEGMLARLEARTPGRSPTACDELPRRPMCIGKVNTRIAQE